MKIEIEKMIIKSKEELNELTKEDLIEVIELLYERQNKICEMTNELLNNYLKLEEK